MNNQITSSSVDNSLIGSNKTLSMRKFNLSTQAELFATLKQLRFSGQMVLTEPKGRRWIIYLHLGCLLYATGGTHPVKRWNRKLTNYLPEQPDLLSTWQSELSQFGVEDSSRGWQYQLLCSWVEQQKISREQATRIIWSTLIEVLFDINQTGNISYELKQGHGSSKGIVLIDGGRVVAEVERQWLAWQRASLTNLNPNQALVIKQPDELQQRTSAPLFQMLSQLLGGQQTLRDVALEMKRDLLTVTRSLLPYIQAGLVELVNIPDAPAPVLATSVSASVQSPLIACVDDSPLICHSLETFLSTTGYRFVGINEPLRAFSVLLALKPDFIFLDLMMPNTNGYEICDKLRRIATFRNTPIVILTGNDGVVDRVRAKIVGASGFLSKAKVDAEAVREVLTKHLRHCTLSKLKGSESSAIPKKEQAA